MFYLDLTQHYLLFTRFVQKVCGLHMQFYFLLSKIHENRSKVEFGYQVFQI